MLKTEVLHELYHLCNEINFNDSHEIISSAESDSYRFCFTAETKKSDCGKEVLDN